MSYTILVIEDTDFIREDVAMTLEFEGYEPITAEDGVIGLEKAKAEKPDLILCDVAMPRLDGLGVLKELRQTEGIKATPFIFLTARTEKSDMRVGMELGADDYLTKPFSTEELISAVNSQLKKKKQVEQHYEAKLDQLRDNISYALPHEFRTALIGILGYSDILLDVSKAAAVGIPIEADELGDLSVQIRTSAQRLQRLTENFLVYSQLQVVASNPKEVSNLRRYDHHGTNEVIEETVFLHANDERKKDVTLDLTDTSVQISGENFRKIVSELYDNASKFGKSPSPISISSSVKDKIFTMVFRDSGRGMDEEQRKNIGAYQQFERKKYEQQGAGLGLIITKLLIDIHGGTLSIDSEIDNGTTVTVTLPIASRPPEFE